ncbi:MAG: serine hydrolase [Pyrinomonadaceae bacterium]
MQKFIRLSGIVLIFAMQISYLSAKTGGASESETRRGFVQQTILNNAIEQTLKEYEPRGLKPEEIAATLIDLRAPKNVASYRGSEKLYPASVVKMFYMVYLHRLLQDGKIKMTPELNRGLTDMIVVSSNDATQYILDVITGTTSGPELSASELEKWGYQRNVVNRYFSSLGYKDINVNQKTYCEDAYGREQQFRGKNGVNRNMLTTVATAKLLYSIVTGNAVTKERSAEMMKLMRRDWENQKPDAEHIEFVSYALSPGTKLWSKEGWTSVARHDAAYIETADGQKLVLVVFTEHHTSEQQIIPSVARKVIKALGEIG